MAILRAAGTLRRFFCSAGVAFLDPSQTIAVAREFDGKRQWVVRRIFQPPGLSQLRHVEDLERRSGEHAGRRYLMCIGSGATYGE